MHAYTQKGEGKSFLWKQIMFGIFEDDSDDDGDMRNEVDDDDDDYDDDGGKVLVKFV